MDTSKSKTPTNPSRTATARVKHPLPVPTICHFCTSRVQIATHQEVYGRDCNDWPYVYLCQGCGAHVGLHPFTAIPLGTLADKTTRQARKECKTPFEYIWQSRFMSRSQAYGWLAKKMGIPAEKCHFGWFDIKQCQQAKQICEDYLSTRLTRCIVNEYHYQRRIEQSLEQYDRLLISDPDEQEELVKRIAFLRQHSKMLSAFKSAIKNSCMVAGSGSGHLAAFTDTTAMELYLDEVQKEIFLRVAKAERAMELDTENDHQLQ